MGHGAIIIGMAAEVTLPTLLFFAICYSVMVGKREYGKTRAFLAFLTSLLSGGATYAVACLVLRVGQASQGNSPDFSMVLILALPVIFSAAAIWVFAPKKSGSGVHVAGE